MRFVSPVVGADARSIYGRCVTGALTARRLGLTNARLLVVLFKSRVRRRSRLTAFALTRLVVAIKITTCLVRCVA